MSLVEAELTSAVLITLGLALYAVLCWRAAPAAFHAIVVVALLSFATGAVAALGIEGLLRGVSLAPGFLGGGGKADALTVGKAIILTDEKHSGDTFWEPISEVAKTCREGLLLKDDSIECHAAYLAMHALGKDLDRGPREKEIEPDEIAEICGTGALEKDSSLCQRAFAARNAKMK